jgi:hypothetical protein
VLERRARRRDRSTSSSSFFLSSFFLFFRSRRRDRSTYPPRGLCPGPSLASQAHDCCARGPLTSTRAHAFSLLSLFPPAATHQLARLAAAGQLAGLQAYAYSSLREKRADDARAQIAAGARGKGRERRTQ